MGAKALQTANEACEIEFVDERKVKNVRKAMKSAGAILPLAETFKILGDPTRIKITFALSREELCVCDLANLLGVSQSSVSHGLWAARLCNDVKNMRKRRSI